MKYLFLVLLIILSDGCRNSKTGQTDPSEERYKLAPELADHGKKDHDHYWKKSRDWIVINTESGDFKGIYKQVDFSGNFVIKKVSGGFTKGFYYTVELGFLEKDMSGSRQTDKFFDRLSSVKRLYFYPDNLNNPSWINLEITSESDKGILKFILKKV